MSFDYDMSGHLVDPESVRNKHAKIFWKQHAAVDGRPMPEQKRGEKWDLNKKDWFLLPLELIEPLAEVMIIGEKKGYGNFSCMEPFENSNRRFFNSTMRHLVASQRDPLAMNKEYRQDGTEAGECYHLACVAFGALMRLYHARKESENKQTGL